MKNIPHKILISSCLLGNAVRYDATDLKQSSDLLTLWLKQDRLLAFCPEVSAGMSIPRAAAEIVSGSGADVLAGKAQVIDHQALDVSEFFIKGANNALKLCEAHEIKIAILTERSPSCGGKIIYNGAFNRTKIAGEGVTAALLKSRNIQVFNQHELEKVSQLLR